MKIMGNKIEYGGQMGIFQPDYDKPSKKRVFGYLNRFYFIAEFDKKLPLELMPDNPYEQSPKLISLDWDGDITKGSLLCHAFFVPHVYENTWRYDFLFDYEEYTEAGGNKISDIDKFIYAADFCREQQIYNYFRYIPDTISTQNIYYNR
jgi:hypothetical protein